VSHTDVKKIIGANAQQQDEQGPEALEMEQL